MYTKIEVSFPVEGDVVLHAWLFSPEGPGPFPAISMAHGFAGTRYHGIEGFARAYCEAGFVVLLHDHRGFGDSGGIPRNDVNPWQQITDWRRAISFLQSQKNVDSERIGVWGSSYAGGHAIVLGATDRRIKAVVAQVPTISGFETGLRRVQPEAVEALEARLAADERAQFEGAAPSTHAIVSADPSVPASYRTAEAIDFYTQEVPAGVWQNEVTLRSMRWARMYEPGVWIERVSPTPLLMVVARRDNVAVTDLALKAYERALEPKRLALIDGGHFAPYLEQFPVASGEAVIWFKTHLLRNE